MNNRKRLLNLIGLTRRAGKIISGEELATKTIQSEKAQLIFLVNDADANSIKRTADECQYYKTEISIVLSTLELSATLGEPRKAVAVTDAGFSRKMRILMN